MRSSRRLKAITVAALALAPAGAVAADRGAEQARVRAPAASSNFDARVGRPVAARSERTRSAQAALRRSLGENGLLRIDRATGTPKLVARRGGFLTRRSSRSPEAIALGYLRENAAALGLDGDGLDGLEVFRRYTTRRGLTHIEWSQVHEGLPVFGSLIRANVSGGRLLSVTGPAVPSLSAAPSEPVLDAAEAGERALASVGVRRRLRPLDQRGRSRRTVLSRQNLAELVIFALGSERRLAWSVIATADGDSTYRIVVDARSGRILKRANLVAHASVTAHEYYPGAPDAGGAGGVRAPRPARTGGSDPWLTGTFSRLRGDNTWTYSDEYDDTHFDCDQSKCFDLGEPDPGQEVPPSSGGGDPATATWSYLFVTADSIPGSNCHASGCSWDSGPGTLTAPFAPGGNWQRNRRQNAAQVFHFVNTFHDHTQADPGIDFADTQGNFEQTADAAAEAAGALDGDPVHAQVDDGAALAPGTDDFPDGEHLNNASMLTLPERFAGGAAVPPPYRAPRMEMFLFGDLLDSTNASRPNDVNGGDDAQVVYHEYVHGLSSRLVDPDGSGDLFTAQGGAMSEGWSDWYMLDYVIAKGFETDAPGAVDVPAGEYENAPFVSEAYDCKVGQSSPLCPGSGTAGSGGYTYGDLGRIFSPSPGVVQPEVHADGEIWSQTLLDLRDALVAAHPADGVFRARALVTDAMRLSPADPSFLDMRDAILTANTLNGFGDADLIWSVFARRGMGLCASTAGPDDTAPDEDFRTPSQGPCVQPTTATPPPPPPLTPPAKASLSLFPRVATVDRRGRFKLIVRGGAGLRGTIAVRSVRRIRTSSRSTARRRVTFARRSFALPTAGRVTLTLRLSRRNRGILRFNRRVSVRATVRLTNAAGGSSATRRFTLRPRRR